MSAHTPGPWHVLEGHPRFGSAFYVYMTDVDGNKKRLIDIRVLIRGDSRSDSDLDEAMQEARATAYVVAAATDLLAACKLAARYLDPAQYPDAVKAVDAAIAKAEGGAP